MVPLAVVVVAAAAAAAVAVAVMMIQRHPLHQQQNWIALLCQVRLN